MAWVLLFLSLSFGFLFFLGLINPRWVLPFLKDKSRWASSVIYGAASFLAFIIAFGTGMSSIIQSYRDRASSSTSKPENTPIALGTPFQLGKFTYTIKAAETKQSIGGYANHKAQEGASLLIVKYSIHNDGDRTETVMTDDFKIEDFKGRSFRPSSEANTAYMMSNKDKDFILSEIQPGLKKDMVSVFELPTESINAKGLKVIVPEKGWGSEKVVVKLD